MIRHNPGLRLAALLLIAAALLMRAAVPGGWMPDASAHGWRIIPCPGTAPAAEHAHAAMPGMAHHMPAKSAPARHDHPAESPCDFAGAAQAASLPDFAPAPSLAPEAPPAAPVARLAAPAVLSLAAPPPPATGPPLRA